MVKTKFISVTLTVLLLLTGCTNVNAATLASSSNNNSEKPNITKQLETNHFNFYSKNQDKSCLNDLSKVVEESYSTITTDLQTALNKKVDVYIYSDLDTYHNSINQPDAPKWVVGNADIDSNSIHMVNPTKADDRSYSEVKKVIVHEFTHLVEHSLNPSENGIPIWLDEGVASFEAKQDDGTKQVLSKCKASKKFPTLKSLETDSISFGHNGGYQFSYSIVNYIVKTYGYDKLVALIKSPSDFENILGISKVDFEKKWVASIN